MDERIDEADIEVEEPDEPSAASFPVVGTDRTPTPEMLAQGVHGNGSWNLTDESLEVAYAEVHQAKKQDRDERRHFFNESAKDALLDAIQLHHRIVKRGLDVMDRIENPSEDSPVTSKDMAVLSMAQKSSKELADRGMGKATTSHEEEASTSLLAILKRKESGA